MLKISLLGVLLNDIPESFLFVFASYLFYHKKLDKKRIFISTIILTFVVYVTRLLPIEFGVHTILDMVLYSFLCVNINGISAMAVIQYSFILVFMLFSSEILNMFILNNIYGNNIKTILNNDLLSNICSIPSIMLFCLDILIFYRLLYKERRRNI